MFAVVAALLVGTTAGLLIGASLEDDDHPTSLITRGDLIEAFGDEGIELEKQFGSSTGLVDASFTVSSDQPPDMSPLVVELLRTIPSAEAREKFLIEKAPESDVEITVLRSRNAVAALIGRDVELFERVRSVMSDLE